MPKFICLDLYDTFTSTDEEIAKQHAADNPGHSVVGVGIEGEREIAQTATTKMEAEEEN